MNRVAAIALDSAIALILLVALYLFFRPTEKPGTVARPDPSLVPAASFDSARATAIPWDVGHTTPLLEVTNFTCRFCRQQEGVNHPRGQDNPSDSSIAMLILPFWNDSASMKSARHAVCAAAQDKFGVVARALFASEAWLSAPDSVSPLVARLPGIDSREMASCVTGKWADSVLAAHQAASQAIGVVGTPSWYWSGGGRAGMLSSTDLDSIVASLRARPTR